MPRVCPQSAPASEEMKRGRGFGYCGGARWLARHAALSVAAVHPADGRGTRRRSPQATLSVDVRRVLETMDRP
jgi:hypothetical protein